MDDELALVLGRHVLDDAPSGLVVLDEGGALVAANAAARQLGAERVLAPPSTARVAAFLDALRAHGQASLSGDVAPALALDGVVRGRWCLVHVRDLAEERARDAELKQLRAGASLAFLAASALHDFNNLLAPVLILSSRLRQEVANDTHALSLASEIESQAALAASLMRDVLSLARPAAPGSTEVTVVDDLLLSRRRLIMRIAGDDIEVLFELDAPEARVAVDR